MLRRSCCGSRGSAVELLVISKFEAQANLLFSPKWLHFTGRRDLRGLPPSHHDVRATVLLPKCDLVLHVATVENWFLRLIESTGPEAYVQTLRERVGRKPRFTDRQRIRLAAKAKKASLDTRQIDQTAAQSFTKL